MSLSLATAIFWIAAALCLVAEIAIVRSALVVRSAPGGAVPRSRRPIEVLWTLLPAIALAFVLAATWRAMQQHAARATGATPAARSDAGLPSVSAR